MLYFVDKVIELQKRISGIVDTFNDFINQENELDYLRTISHNVFL